MTQMSEAYWILALLVALIAGAPMLDVLLALVRRYLAWTEVRAWRRARDDARVWGRGYIFRGLLGYRYVSVDRLTRVSRGTPGQYWTGPATAREDTP